MNLRHLETFVTAAELQSFTRAADVLSVTQSAVSQHVSALAKEFDVSLFERSGRSVALTEAGRRLYEHARKVLDILDQARQEIGRGRAPVAGELRIAACGVAAESILPGVLARFRRQYPQVAP